MSINWYASLGYGFSVNVDAIEKTLGTDDYLYQDFDSELERRYPLLTIAYAGDSFSGNGSERFVVVKSSLVKARDWVQNFDLDQLNASMNGDGVDQLWQFFNETGGADGDLEWRLCINCG